MRKTCNISYKLVARLDDGTISVDTVKHPVSFGQVAVLNAIAQSLSRRKYASYDLK